MKLLHAFLRLFFSRFYTTLAWTYDAVAAVVSVGQWNEWVRLAAGPVRNDPVLELGHGPGHLLAALAEQGRFAVGIDASRQMNRMASIRMRKTGKSSHIVQAKAQALPFAAGLFGSMVTTFPTEYALDPATIAEAWRALHTDGTFVIIPVSRITGSSLLDRAAAWLFAVTGQSAELPVAWLDQWKRAGFSLQREEIRLGRSIVTRIIGTKPGAHVANREPDF